MDAAFMGDQALAKQCPDCGVTYHAHHPLCVRCAPCQRVYRNAETSKRDAARRKRQKLAEQAVSVLGLNLFDVVRDNGHRCRECRRVLWINAGKAPHYCHECQRMRDAIDVAADVLAFIAGHAIGSGRSCVVCGDIVPVVRRNGSKTCSKACSLERKRQKSREKYERLTGVKAKPLNARRVCKWCGCDVIGTNVNGRGRSVCDQCGIHHGTFKARARLYGVRYEHVDRTAIYQRDGWRCQLCGRKTLSRGIRNKKTHRLHPRSPSIDHITPMSRGGDHVESNCQCACLSCNVRKHARLIGQRRLF
jgi:5-methylcytosine-specific restriction endonuclease McrA